MGISENIKILREQYGLSQKDLGKIAGVSDKAVSTWENGLKDPRMGAIQKIADHFGLQKSDLIEDDGMRKATPIVQLELSNAEEKLIKKYRQLDADGKEEIDELIEFKLTKLQRNAEKDERNLG